MELKEVFNNSNLVGMTVWGNLGFLVLMMLIWSFVWKGWALYRAARNNHTVWFIALLVFNTLGILEIIYIFVFSGYRKISDKSIKTE